MYHHHQPVSRRLLPWHELLQNLYRRWSLLSLSLKPQLYHEPGMRLVLVNVVRRPDDVAFVPFTGSLPCGGAGRTVVWKRQRH